MWSSEPLVSASQSLVLPLLCRRTADPSRLGSLGDGPRSKLANRLGAECGDTEGFNRSGQEAIISWAIEEDAWLKTEP